jgi:hypothetical protein
VSKKGKKIDVLGEAHLPSDLLTPSLSTKFLLDGFEDDDYGLGLLERDMQLDTEDDGSGYKIEADADPASFFAEEDDDLGLHFDALLKEGNDGSDLADLNWLELVDQDPDRLPKDTTETAIPELEEAWGTDRRTDGVHVHPTHQVDLDQARYDESLKENTSPSFRFDAKDLQRVVRRAMRRSASGYAMQDILREAAEALEDEAHRIKSAMKLVKEEHGLSGRVFIRASAYPGYEQGKFGREIRKFQGAKYIVVDGKTLEGSTHIQNGHCTITGKTAVTQVPWKEAYQYYRPLLEATGRKVAGGDHREALRAAFLSHPEKVARPAHQLPTHQSPSQRVSSAEAHRRFKASPAPARTVYDALPAIEEQRRRQAWAKVQAWAKAGLVPLDEAMGVIDSEISGEGILQRVAALVMRTKEASAFSGLTNDVRPTEATLEEARKALASVEAPAPIDISNRPKEAARRKAIKTLARWVHAGFITEQDAKRLARSKAEPIDVLKAASALATSVPKSAQYSGVGNDDRVAAPSRDEVFTALHLAETSKKGMQELIDRTVMERRASSTQAARKLESIQEKVATIKTAIDKGVRGLPLRKLILRTIPAAEVRLASRYLVPLLKESGALEDADKTSKIYEGVAYRQIPQKVASVNPHAREVQAMLAWTSRSLNEGFAGNDLDELLAAKFSSTVRNAGAKELKELRKAHEGGAGFIYVDASAYASKTGTKGCESASLKHRANRVRFVLGMDRCATCAKSRKKADGTHVCGPYKKEIVTASDLPDEITEMRRANVKAANMDDAESTASMFESGYDAAEFDLQSPLENDLEFDAAPEGEELADIVFGGMEF